MKEILAAGIGILTSVSALAGNSDKDRKVPDGHVFVEDWRKYDQAVKDDLPQTELDILSTIIDKAGSAHSRWDFYDAAVYFREISIRRNWKQSEEQNALLKSRLEKFNDPVLTIWRSYNYAGERGQDFLSLIQEHRQELISGNDPVFAQKSAQGNPFGLVFRNDYESALWLAVSRRSEKAESVLSEELSGAYPLAASVEFYDISRYQRTPDLEAFAEKYKGKAAALFAEEALLRQKYNGLGNKNSTSSESWKAFRDECMKFQKSRKAFSGEERKLAMRCDLSDIIKSMDSRDIQATIKDNVLTARMKNLRTAEVSLVREGSNKAAWTQRITDNSGHYCVQDTVKVSVPDLPDGNYVLKVTARSIKNELNYHKYSLSVAYRSTSDGLEIYVADYKSGKPVDRVDIKAEYTDGSTELFHGFSLDGFTPLRKEMLSKRNQDGKALSLRSLICSFTDSQGLYHCSDEVSAYYNVSAVKSSNAPGEDMMRASIVTDCGLYKPGSEVRFKAILYEDCEYSSTKKSHTVEGESVMITLMDADGRQVASMPLVTGPFGSVSGAFDLPDGMKPGRVSLTLKYDGRTLCSRYIRLEEYVLPSFTMSVAPQEERYFPGDMIVMKGVLKSYSGRSLQGAEAICSLHKYGNGEESLTDIPVRISDDGSFEISFPADELRNPDDRYSSYWYQAEVKYVDATGEVVTASTAVTVAGWLNLSYEILDRNDCILNLTEEARLKSGTWEHYMISGDGLRLKVHSEYVTDNAVCIYRLRDGDNVIAEGHLPVGEDTEIKLPSTEPALYTVELSLTKNDQRGRAHSSDTMRFCVMTSPEADGIVLPDGVKDFVRALAEDDVIGLQFGHCDAPIWAIAEIWDYKGHIVKCEKVLLPAGESVKTLRFDYADSYPDKVQLSLFYFKDGEAMNWTHAFQRPVPKTSFPLEFSRFVDTTGPGTVCEITLKTDAGAECAVAVFDKTTESYQANVWNPLALRQPREVYLMISSVCGRNETDWGRVYARSAGRLLTKASANAMVMNDMAVMEEAVQAGESFDMANGAMMEAAKTPDAIEEELESLDVRMDMADILAFEPSLRSDSEGNVHISFTTSDKLSTYYVNVLAHDRNARSAVARREMMVTLPVQLSLAQPQFLYEGDRYVLKAAVSCEGKSDFSGNILFTLTDGSDVVKKEIKPVTVAAGGTSSAMLELKGVPHCNSGKLGVKLAFSAKDAEGHKVSDALYAEIPVLEAAQTITESHSALLRSRDDINTTAEALRSQFVNLPGGAAEMKEISIRDMLEDVLAEVSEPKSQDAIALMGSASVRYVSGRGDASQLIANLLDCRNVDGGFAWRQGLKSSPAVTAYVLETAALLAKRGIAIDTRLSSVLSDAVRYIDADMFNETRPWWGGGLTTAQYAYVRSLYADTPFDQKISKERKDEFRAYFDIDNAMTGNILAKVRRHVTVENLLAADNALVSQWGLKSDRKLSARIRKDIESTSQYAVAHVSGGSYFPDAVLPWRGLFETEAYAHSFICNALAPYRPDLADAVRMWLMVQKETQKWPSDPACVNAVMSVMDGSEDMLGAKVLVLSASGRLPFSKISQSGNGMSLSQKWLVRTDDGWKETSSFKAGDTVKVQYRLWSEENRSFVVFKAQHPACMLPVEKLSGSRYGSYREVHPDRIEYWYTAFPEEVTVIEEVFQVTQSGEFSSAASEAVCTYASHYSAVDMPQKHVSAGQIQ